VTSSMLMTKERRPATRMLRGWAILAFRRLVPSDFSVLQNELKGSSKSIVLVAFDLLYLLIGVGSRRRSARTAKRQRAPRE
jgi:hypothetical protein